MTVLDMTRYALKGVGYILLGMFCAVVIVALALPVMAYIIYTNWKDYTL